MSGNKKILELLNAYLAGTSTTEEVAELMWLIKTGSYDDLLREEIDKAFRFAGNKNVFDEGVSKQILADIIGHGDQGRLIASEDGFKQWKQMAAAAAIILLFLTAAWLIFLSKKANTKILAHEEKVTPVPSVKKDRKYFHLADGSTVLLNEGSHLEYPEQFVGNTREVTLTGEGYFDIHHDPSKPFIVHTGNVSTTVLGTAFNIKAYPDQNEIMVTVTRGKVKVSSDKEILGVITTDESIEVNTTNYSFHKNIVSAEEQVAWKKQYLVFDDISLGDAAVLITARYNVSISFAKESLRDCRISATFLNNESLEQVLAVITGVVNAHFISQPNDQVIISGEGCN